MNAIRYVTSWLSIGVLGILLFISGKAQAEARPADPSNPLSYISQLGPVTFDKAGGAFLPVGVLSAVKEGEVSPVMQFVLASHMMNSCIKDVTKPEKVPGRRDPYVVAKAKFQYGICRIKRCYQQGMMLSMLSSLSDNPEAGGSSDPGTQAGSQQSAMSMAQAFNKDSDCDGADGGSNGLDPMMMMMMMGKK